jgi:pyruvyltransferase
MRTLGGKNFGDAVNKTFWEKMTNKKIAYNSKEIHYITTGSIMCLVENNSIVFGTGFISKDGDIGGRRWGSKRNKVFTRPQYVIAVRGPLTRQKLLKNNIPCPENYGDPLILMPCIYDKQKVVNENIVGIILHYHDENKNKEKVMKLKKNLEKSGYDVKFIDILVGNDYKKIIDEINDCKYIISSSLHGVIMGIVYKKITCFAKFGDSLIGGQFKFQDFFQSIDINYKYKHTIKSNILKNYIRVDYDKLYSTGTKLIKLIPFVDQQRKIELHNIYTSFYNK